MKSIKILRIVLPIIIVLICLLNGIFIRLYSTIYYPGTSIRISDETLDSLKYYNIFSGKVTLTEDFKKFISSYLNRMRLDKTRTRKGSKLGKDTINIDTYRFLINQWLKKELRVYFRKRHHCEALETTLIYSVISLLLFWIIVCFVYKYRETI